MAEQDVRKTQRFICTYYNVPREIENAEEEWRGWIALVPDDPQEAVVSPPSRVWYRGIDDLPRAMRRLLAGE